MKKNKTNGITLIALIITIIVLLILAGVTIAALTGSDNAPSKANEAKQKNDIGVAKDDVYLETQNAQTEAYERVYVEGKQIDTDEDVKAVDASTNVGAYVRKKLNEKYGTDGNFKIGLATITSTSNGNIVITTKDFTQTGNIDIKGGRLEWNNDNDEDDFQVADASGANKPSLKGFTTKNYVTWTEKKNTQGQGTGEYEINDTLTSVPNDWYDYDHGKWANLKTTANGYTAYWVWIPRYEYKVPTSSSKTMIDVKFIGTDVTSTNGKADQGYTVHPAFTFKGKELSGIWFAKFEACSNNPYTLEDGGFNDGTHVQVLPSVPSWRSIVPDRIFAVCREMTSPGGALEGTSNIDSHMMKNIEWGAVALLSDSKYGVYNSNSATGANGDNTKQVWNNPYYQRVNYSFDSTRTNDLGTVTVTENDIIKTGCAAKTAGKDALQTISCDDYNKGNGPKASTTGTVYGVYDMAGGANEYVAACLSGYETTKFGVDAGDNTYVDIYTGSGSAMAKVGDATKETKGWNNDYGEYVKDISPVFLRGGKYSGGADAGTYCFAFGGAKHYYSSFRPVLAYDK